MPDQQPAAASQVTAAAVAAIASAGAAVIHAAAAGIHADTTGLARAFIVLAVAQFAVAVAGFVRGDRLAAAALVAVNGVAVLGWMATRLVGISWIAGLEVAERPQLADIAAAILAIVSVAAAMSVLAGRPPALSGRAVTNVAILTVVLVVPGLADATTHDHGGHEHDAEVAADAHTDHEHSDGIADGGAQPVSATEKDDHTDHELTDDSAPTVPDEHGDHADHAVHDEQEVATSKPYDPALPIDLGGVDGVTLQQQAFAENLVAATVRDLPQWADLDVVEAAGFHSIGDGATGHEHFIQWDWIDDDVWLDPDHPESLVFEPQPDGTKLLVSAMFMLPGDYALEDIPDWGGALMQWHVHGDLCFTDDPVAPRVAGTKPLGGKCSPPLVDMVQAPMIHVWIRPHECGPFAALDGIGGGQVPDGEEVLCDHAHGTG